MLWTLLYAPNVGRTYPAGLVLLPRDRHSTWHTVDTRYHLQMETGKRNGETDLGLEGLVSRPAGLRAALTHGPLSLLAEWTSVLAGSSSVSEGPGLNPDTS